MATEIRVLWDDAAVTRWTRDSPALGLALDRLAARVQVAMKAACPVSPVVPAYARRGATVPGGRRLAGDFPLRPSGFLRNSIRREPQPDGSVRIGTDVSYASYVNDGTVPHLIESHGPWPLRNRGTGQVFGRLVHHPGTTGAHFVEKGALAIEGERIHV